MGGSRVGGAEASKPPKRDHGNRQKPTRRRHLIFPWLRRHCSGDICGP